MHLLCLEGLALLAVICTVCTRAAAAPATRPAQEPGPSTPIHQMPTTFVITAAESQPAGPLVPIETLKKSFAATYKQGQVAESKDNIQSLQQSLGFYKKLLLLAQRHPDITDNRTKSDIESRAKRVQERLEAMRRTAKEEKKKERAARAAAAAERRARNAPRPITPIIVGPPSDSTLNQPLDSSSSPRPTQNRSRQTQSRQADRTR